MTIAMTVSKIAEGVQLLGPSLHHKNPLEAEPMTSVHTVAKLPEPNEFGSYMLSDGSVIHESKEAGKGFVATNGKWFILFCCVPHHLETSELVMRHGDYIEVLSKTGNAIAFFDSPKKALKEVNRLRERRCG